MKSRDEEKRWLSLGVGQNNEDCYSRSKAISVRVCNFCKRKFYSPQALGGHQNAHKKEKEAARRRRFFYASTMQTIHRTLGVHSHHYALPRKPTTTSKTVGVGESGGSMWSGSFQLDSQPSDELTLDLTLKL